MHFIIGNQNPVVGVTSFYEVVDAASGLNILNLKNQEYVWYIYKKEKSGNWKDITINKGKTGTKVPYKFGGIAEGVVYKLEVFKAVKDLFTNIFKATFFSSLEIVPTSNKNYSIEKVVLFNNSTKDPNKATYKDDLVARAYCISMFDKHVEFQLWEDDAPKAGHDPISNKNNKLPKIFTAKVNLKGIAEVKIPLLTNEKILKAIANKYVSAGDKNEGANHEYYVTASYDGKIQGASQVNVNVENSGVQPKRDSAIFSGNSNQPSKSDKDGKITHAYFIDSKGNPTQKIKVGDSVKIRIKTVNMIGEYIQYIVWEKDGIKISDDDIFRSPKMKINYDAIDTESITITQDKYNEGIDLDFDYSGDKDKDQQEYYIEVIPLNSRVKSVSFGIDDKDKRTKVDNVKTAAAVKPTRPTQANTTCVCKNPTLFWGKYFTCEERKKIIEISKRLLCNPNYLTSAMALETGGKFDPSIVNSLGYTGLIQIGSSAAEDINRRKKTNITAGSNGNLKKMSKIDQLTYVEYYLEPFKGKLNTLADFYLAILMPVDCGKGAIVDHIVFDKNIKLDYDKDGKVIKNTKWIRQRAYTQNPVFHKEGKKEAGKTFVWEIAAEIQNWYDKGDANKETSFSCQKTTEVKIKEVEKGIWHDPVDSPRLTKYNYSGINKPSSGTYGWCRRNEDGSKKYHSGFDFFAIPGKDKVYSCLKGNVHQVKYSNNAGWIVRVKIQNVKELLKQQKKVNYTTQFIDELKGINIAETDNVFFIYMHLDSTEVTAEDAKNKKAVDAGTVLGYAGVSGSIASGGKAPHLHLEIATVLDAYGHGESVRTNPARFVKLNSYDTKDQDDEAKIIHIFKK